MLTGVSEGPQNVSRTRQQRLLTLRLNTTALSPSSTCPPGHSLRHRAPRTSFTTSLQLPSAASPVKNNLFSWATSTPYRVSIMSHGPRALDSLASARRTTAARDCSSYELLCIANSFFKTMPQHKVSRLNNRHQLDFILVRRSAIMNVLHTRSYHSADCNTDHSMVCCKTKLQPEGSTVVRSKRILALISAR